MWSESRDECRETNRFQLVFATPKSPRIWRCIIPASIWHKASWYSNDVITIWRWWFRLIWRCDETWCFPHDSSIWQSTLSPGITKFQLEFLEKNVVLERFFELKGHQVPRVFVTKARLLTLYRKWLRISDKRNWVLCMILPQDMSAICAWVSHHVWYCGASPPPCCPNLCASLNFAFFNEWKSTWVVVAGRLQQSASSLEEL